MSLAVTAKSVKQAATTSARMCSSSPHRPLTGRSQTLRSLQQILLISCRTPSASTKRPSLNRFQSAFTRVGAATLPRGKACSSPEQGPIGLTSLAAAKASGATQIFISDVRPHRLEVAKQMGATHTFDAKEDAGAIVRDATNGRGVDLAIECAGAEPAFLSCLKTVKSGGAVVRGRAR